MLDEPYGPALRALEDARSAFERLAMPIEAVEVGWNILDCVGRSYPLN